MSQRVIKILLIEDDEDDYVITRELLREIEGTDFQIDWVADYQSGLRSICSRTHDVCLVDYRLGKQNGIEFLRESSAQGCRIPIILLTGQGDHEVDLAAMKAGAADYLNKSTLTAQLLDRSIRYSIEHNKAQEALREAHDELESRVQQRTAELARANEVLQNEIAARKRWESALQRAKQAADVANRSKSEFLANMSHEIRTPMTAILGFADLLISAETDLEKLDSLQTIKQNGTYLLEILNDILDLSKIEAGKFEIERTRVSPCELVSGVRSLMHGRAKEKSLTLTVEYQGSIPETIETDPTRLRQIFVNLLSNAIKFTERGGVRFVVRFRSERARPMMDFEVIDTGIGIDDEDISRLFEPFSQARASRTRRFGGTGLGLTISRRLTEMLEGEISATSRPGVGSTFRLSIPTGPLEGVRMIEPDKVSAPLKPDSAPASARVLVGRRVLVAEDTRANAYIITRFLRNAGCEVDVVENGEAAVEKVLEAEAADRPYDVVLMDIHMPILDGYQATSRIREQGGRVPVIALTAGAMKGEREKCLAAGCDDYLAKPIDARDLIATVSQHTQPLSPSSSDLSS